MAFNFSLMIKMYIKSFTSYTETGCRFTVKRVVFLILFPICFGFNTLLSWTCLLLDDMIFPGYRRIEIQKPLFIVGYPRSGTTYLHRLINNDADQFSSLKLWEILFAPSILQKKIFLFLGKCDRMIGKSLYRLLIALEDRAFAGSRPMHRLSLFEAEEDEIILIHIFSSAFLKYMFPFEEMDRFAHFDTGVPEKQREAVMRFYKKCVQRHLYVFGADKRFLCKNPASSSKINSIYDTFPNAKVACMVRSPFEAVPSAISWISYGFVQFNDIDPSLGPGMIMDLISHWYTYPLEELDRRPENEQMIDVYDNLTGDPDAFVSGLYERFGYDMSGDYKALLEEQTRNAKKYKSKHSYSLEQYGLTREGVAAKFKPVFDRFGFDVDV